MSLLDKAGLSRLQAEGLITIEGKTVIIPNIADLQAELESAD